MKSWYVFALAAAGIGTLMGSMPEAGGAKSMPFAQSAILTGSPDGGFSVLTYNVHGLPWPLATGRDEAFAQIEDRLARLRVAGAQPHVVVLQEAFTDRAREIGANAGYRHIVDGPTRDMSGGEAKSDVDASFAAAASFAKGETIGRWLGSGLQVLSDYPVLSVHRAAFPALACAGYDCLANKGVLMVTLRVPGQPEPVTVVTTHMNSKRSSGVSEARSFLAYQRQAKSLARFVRENRDPSSPMVFAGDFNASNAPRRKILQLDAVKLSNSPMNGEMRSGLQVAAARISAWPKGLLDEVAYVARRGRDWQFFANGTRTTITPEGLSIPFGRERDGPMLSDHMGLVITYRLAAKG